MKNNRRFLLTIVMFVLVAFSLGISGSAAAAGYHYNVNMQYDAAQADIPAYLKAEGKARNAMVSVAEFVDARQVADKKEIGRVREKDDSKNPIFSKNVVPAKAVAEGVRAYLKKAGYKVADKVVQWDLKEGAVPKGSGKLIIGGTIEELEVSCWRGVFSHAYKANLKLTIVFADAAKGNILYKSKVESSSSRDYVTFSEEELGKQISTALGDAIEKVFKEKEVAQKIKEITTQ